jgi:AraC family transcriptional regulator
MRQGIVLHEGNWNEVFEGIHQFPMRASEIRRVHKELDLSPISFKYTVSGAEEYHIGKQSERVVSGEYVVMTNQPRCEVMINEDRDDLGVCIDIHPQLFSQALQLLQHPNDIDAESTQPSPWLEEQLFLRFKGGVQFQHVMQNIFHSIREKKYHSLALLEMDFLQALLQEQHENFRAYQLLSYCKPTTRKEIFQRLSKARNLLQTGIQNKLRIGELAKQICMSEFRFHHLYKEVFGVSPYHDWLRFKCQEAIQLYQTGGYTWTEISYQLDFDSMAAFSKMFKRVMGYSPVQYVGTCL